jgi:hypothetical protein
MRLLSSNLSLPMIINENIIHIHLNDITKEQTNGNSRISLELDKYIYSMETEFYFTYFRKNIARNQFELWFQPKQENSNCVYNPLDLIVDKIEFDIDTNEIKIETNFNALFFLKDTMMMRCKHQLAGAVKDFNEFKRL